ncbi:MAG: putative toxin-antitoxin system toxin component, PIN family [Verrucomicrobiota bacterium]|jgi:putative PIN family toxin of toxin-antitoxin system
MTVCLDTSVFLQMFGHKQPFHRILRGLLDGRLILAVSTEILLEYEEITVKLSGDERWRDVAAFLELLTQLHGNIRQIEPHYRFGVVVADPDDNKFSDCAIAAGADFVVTEDSYFGALKSAGYKPRPIAPDEFIRLHLSARS